MALGQLTSNPALGAVEDNMHRLLAKLKSLPLSFWRGLIVVVALIWLCRSLATLFWVVFPVPDAPVPTTVAIPAASSAASSASTGQTIDIAGLQSKNLFGDSSGVVLDAPQEIPDVSNTAAKTKLKLELSGVLMSSDPSKSSATIANGSNQDIYQIGDVVPGGNNVKLAKVLPDKVILNNSGKFESLWLYTEADFKSSARASSPSRASTTKSAGVVKSKVAASRVPKSISEVVRMSVYREEGQMKGYRIRPGRDRELFESLGLKANDIVTSVNGATVDDPQQIRQTYQSLKTATEANLEILRDGETVSINISLDTGE